jgi:hypothetical protein
MTLPKLTTALHLGGALLALPAGVLGLAAAYQAHFSGEGTCRDLRGAILSTLEQNVDPQRKRALVHRQLAEFERACALTDPEAKAVFAAFDRTILFAVDPDPAHSRPVRFVPPPPPPFFDRPGGPGESLFRRMRERPFGA